MQASGMGEDAMPQPDPDKGHSAADLLEALLIARGLDASQAKRFVEIVREEGGLTQENVNDQNSEIIDASVEKFNKETKCKGISDEVKNIMKIVILGAAGSAVWDGIKNIAYDGIKYFDSAKEKLLEPNSEQIKNGIIIEWAEYYPDMGKELNEIIRRWVQDRRKKLGASHIKTLVMSDFYAMYCQVSKNSGNALKIREDVYQACLKTFGKNSLNTIAAKGNLGITLLESAKRKDAQKMLSQASQEFYEKVGDNHLWYKASEWNLFNYHLRYEIELSIEGNAMLEIARNMLKNAAVHVNTQKMCINILSGVEGSARNIQNLLKGTS